MKKVTVYVPARIGSKRLHRKALSDFNGVPLIAKILSTLAKCKSVTKFYVNTESEEIADVARGLSVDVFKREARLTLDDTSTEEILCNFSSSVSTEFVAAINPTNPLLQPESIDAFFENQFQNNFDTAFSVTKLKKHVIYENVPINYSPFGPHPRTQDCKALDVINWAIVSWRTDLVKKKIQVRGDSLYLGKIGFIEIPSIDAVDIDDISDFNMAKVLDSQQKV